MKIILKLKLSRHAGALLPGLSPGGAFYFPAPREKGRKSEMKENKNGFTRQEINEFYNNCPEHCEVMEHRKIITEPQIRYITIKIECVYK